MTTESRQPTFYIPHGGGPCFFMDWPYPSPNPWTSLADWLSQLSGTLPQPPRAVLVISGSLGVDPIAVNVQKRPPLLFDYYGFPEHTYRLQYPAPGDPQLAADIRGLLRDAGDSLDHGRQAWPRSRGVRTLPAGLPQCRHAAVQMSLKQGLDPAAHLKLGAALAPLRDQGVLIVGSGHEFPQPARAFHGKRTHSRIAAL